MAFMPHYKQQRDRRTPEAWLRSGPEQLTPSNPFYRATGLSDLSVFPGDESSTRDLTQPYAPVIDQQPVRNPLAPPAWLQDKIDSMRTTPAAFDPGAIFGPPSLPSSFSGPSQSLMTGTDTHYGKQKDEQSTDWDRLSAADQHALALTIAGEVNPADTDYGSEKGRQEVANIVASITDRAANEGKTISQIVHERSQYSTFNTEKGNRTAAGNLKQLGAKLLPAVQDAINGVTTPSMEGITHYHADYVHPTWAAGKPGYQVGPHIFYNNIDPQQNPQLPPAPVGQVASADLPPLPSGPPMASAAGIFGPSSLGPPPAQPSNLDLKRAQIGELATKMLTEHPEDAEQITKQMAGAGLNIDGTPLSNPLGLSGTAQAGLSSPPSAAQTSRYPADTPQSLAWDSRFQSPTMQGAWQSGATAGPPPPSGSASGSIAPNVPLGPGQASAPPLGPPPNANGSLSLSPDARIAGAFSAAGDNQAIPSGLAAAAQQMAGNVPIGPGEATGAPLTPPSASASGNINLSPDQRIGNAFDATGQAAPVPQALADAARQLGGPGALLGPMSATAGQGGASGSAQGLISPQTRIGQGFAAAGQQPQVPDALASALQQRAQLGPGTATAAPPLSGPSATALASPQIRAPLDLNGQGSFGPPPSASASGQAPSILQSGFSGEALASTPEQRMTAALGAAPNISPAMPSGSAMAGPPMPGSSASAQSPLAAPPVALTGQAMSNPLGPPPSGSTAARGPISMAPPTPMAASGLVAPSPITSTFGPMANKEALLGPLDPSAALGIGADRAAAPPLSGPPLASLTSPNRVKDDVIAPAMPLSGPPSITPTPVSTVPFGPPPTNIDRTLQLGGFTPSMQSMAPLPPSIPIPPPMTSAPPPLGPPPDRINLASAPNPPPSHIRQAIHSILHPINAVTGIPTPEQMLQAAIATRALGGGGLFGSGNGNGWNGGGDGYGGGEWGGYQGGTYGGWGGGNIGTGTGGAFRNR